MKKWYHPDLKEYRVKEVMLQAEILEKIEYVFSLKGCLRILYIFSVINLKLTYLELKNMTDLSLGTLNKALERLKTLYMIEKTKEYRKEPRNREESVYFLTEKGKIFCNLVFGYKANLVTTLSTRNLANKLKNILEFKVR